ncbi:hypothetical protein [Corallococcus llansteffanensis]|uniref:Uncharacterized protein n=1 Tax=Corallococcus llansteffanensis TaxID=2316731 RepID=A0A3A8QPI5_9BACT|nr:hypothetical protein [Corallococcus llansteffanensis]RKH68275.1 hypothetical protein D7V93_01535 [Corallococcus llansteffanensis]
MPAPSSSEIENKANSALDAAGIRGANAPDLAGALGQLLGQSLTLFVSMAMVLPGIPAAAPPPAGSGSTTGPGMLLPPPAGGPGPAQLEPLALGALSSKRLNGKGKAALAKVLAQSIGQALLLFTAQVKVAPGLAIAGFATAAPGMLMGPAPAGPVLRPLVLGFAQAQGLRGRDVPDLAGAIADVLAWALGELITRLKVTPGIASTPAATAAPGRLM